MRLQLNAHKIWAIIFALVMLATLSVPVRESALAQDVGSLRAQMETYMNQHVEDRISSYKFSKLKIKKGQDPNIYLTLFNELGPQAHNKVLQSMQSQGYDNIAVGTVDQGAAVQSELRDVYEEELAFYTQLAKHQNESLALEMFMNGSKRDGDFDLLDDLQTIEDILFARRQDGQLGDSLDRSRDSGGIIKDTDFERPKVIGSDEPTSNPADDDTTDDESTDDDENDDSPVIHEEGDICQVDDELAAELEEFIEEALGESSSEEDSEDDTPDGEDGSDIGGGDSGAGTTIGKDGRIIGSFLKRDEECDEVFCFRVEKIKVSETSYYPDDNGCIACVLENLAESLNELNSQNVYPRKVTGNFLEPNMCKGSFGNLKFDLSVSLVERPIFSSDPVDEVTELSARSLIQRWRNNRSSSSRDDETERAVEAQLNLGNPSDITELAALTDQTEAQVDLERRIQEGLFPVASSIDAESGLVQDLHQRMNTLTVYFDSFNQMLSSMQSTLTALNSKPVCE